MKECKLVVLGAGGVGKSSLLVQYLQGHFSSFYKPTIEDCYSHTMQLPNGLFHALDILDTSGSHHFPAMRELCIRRGRAFVIVFAVNNEQSFYDAQSLWNLIKEIKEVDNVPVVVVGNKIDLSSEREVTWQTASEFVNINMSNGSYIETSAKYNLYVSDVFFELLIQTFGMPKEDRKLRGSRLSLSVSNISIRSRRKSSTNGSSNTLSDISSGDSILTRTTSSFSESVRLSRTPSLSKMNKRVIGRCLSLLSVSRCSFKRRGRSSSACRDLSTDPRCTLC